MKIAHVQLYRQVQVSSALPNTYTEEVRGHARIEWHPHHVSFVMKNGSIIAYKADRIHEIVETFEEE